MLRKTGTKDLGPFAAVLASGQNLLEGQKQRNYMGLKVTVIICSWGKLGTTRYKKTKKNPTSTSKDKRAKMVPGAKAEHSSCPLHTTPPKG